MKKIVVFNQKGGVGKTTTALNLAAALSRLNREALMIDLDPQGHLTAILNKSHPDVSQTIFAFYRDNTPLDQLEMAWPGIGHLIPAHTELIKVDSIFGKGPNILNKLSSGLAGLEQLHPSAITLIDCCPFLGVLSLNAIFASDCIIVPVSSDHLSLRGAQQIDRTLKAIEPVLKRRAERRYLLTRFDRRRKMCYLIEKQMHDLFGSDMCETVISENVSVAEAPALGRDIFSHDSKSRGAQDYAALVKELTAQGILVV